MSFNVSNIPRNALQFQEVQEIVKKILFDLAANINTVTLIFFEHFPYDDLVKIEKISRKLSIIEKKANLLKEIGISIKNLNLNSGKLNFASLLCIDSAEFNRKKIADFSFDIYHV